MKKRFLALLLFSSLLFGIIFSHYAFVSAAEHTLSPNVAALNAILYGNRGWVRDTLIDDNRSTNPMRILAGGDDLSMAANALNTYRGLNAENETYAEVYRYGVNVMLLLYSPETIMNDVVDETGNLLSWIASFFSGTDDLRRFLDDMAASSDELDYDKILKEAFSKTYTASNGTTLGDTEASYLLLQGMVDSLTMLSKIENAISADIGATDGTGKLEDVYINDYVAPYTDAVEDFLSKYFSLTGTSSPDATALTTCASLLATIARFNRYAPEDTYTDYPYVETLNEMLLDSGISDLLKDAGKVLDISSGALENYIYIESIQRQRETLTGPIQRLASRTGNASLKKSATNFNSLMNDQLDAKVLAYDSIVSYLRSNTVVSDTTSKLITSWFKNSSLYKDGFLSSPVLSKALTSISIGSWLGDKVTGAKNTCKKTALLLRWENLLNAALSSYYADETAYISNATDENAKKVLEDLQMIQRLRLYGEKVAHELSAAQLDSWFGQLYCDNVTRDAWDDTHQQSVDILLAASVVPAMSGLNVGNGQQVFLLHQNNVGTYAHTPKGYLVDLSSLLLGGISINGGSLIVTGSISHLGVIQTSGAATLGVAGSSLTLADVYQNSGSLDISLAAGSALHTNTLNVSNAAVTAVDGNGSITTDQLTLRGSISGVPIHVKGDVSCSGATATHLELTGSNSHTISGSLTAGTFRMVGGPVQLNGNVTVTGELYGPNAVIQNPERLLLNGGTVTGGSYPAVLKVKNARLSNTVFHDDLTDQGGTTYSGTTTIHGLYSVQNSLTIPSGSVLRLMSAGSIKGLSVSGTGQIQLRSDAVLSNSQFTPDLHLTGILPQTISGPFTVNTIYFENTSKNGVTVDGSVTITKALYDSTGNVNSSSELVLSESATIPGGSFGGDLIFDNWTSTTPLTLGGSAVFKNSTLTGTQLSVGKNLTLNAANCTLQDCKIDVNGAVNGSFSLHNSTMTAKTLQATGPLSIDSASALNVNGSALLSKTVVCDGPLVVRNDCLASSVSTTGAYPIVCGGDLSVSGTTHFHHLQLQASMPQMIEGSSFTADTLELYNTSVAGVTVSCGVTVSQRFEAGTTRIIGADRITNSGQVGQIQVPTKWKDVSILQDTHITGDLHVSGSLTIQGATLTVSGQLVLSGGSLSIDAGSKLSAAKSVSLSSFPVSLDGELCAGSDLVLASSPISGSGTLRLRGDLSAGTNSIQMQHLFCSGLLHQVLSGSGRFKTTNITLTNPSRKGVIFENTIYYSGTLDRGTTAVTGSEKLIPEVAQ